MPRPQTILPLILAALREHGEMTIADICEASGLKREQVENAINRNRNTPDRCVRVKKWLRPEDGKKGKHSAVFAIGSKPDAKPLPPYTKTDRNQRYAARHAAIFKLREIKRRKKVVVSNPFDQLLALAG